MKNFTRILALVLACVMMLALAACGGNAGTTAGNTTVGTTAGSTAEPTTEPTAEPTTEPTEPEPEKTLEEKVLEYMDQLAAASAPGLNTYESDWDTMVAYLTEQGVIAADAEQVDMLTTAGYLKKYDGTYEDTYAFADKAVDFGGLYLVWWDLVDQSSAYSCYSQMVYSAPSILVSGGMYVVVGSYTQYGSYAIAFADNYDETAKENALAVLNAVDSTIYSLDYLSSVTDLAMGMMKAGLLAATDIAGAVDLNNYYAYTATRQDWVGYDQSETGYGDPYETTAYAFVASSAYQFGNVTVLYYAPGDVGESSYYPYYVSMWKQINEDGALTPWTRPTTAWTYETYKVDADGNYNAEGTDLVIEVTAVYGQFVIIVNE